MIRLIGLFVASVFLASCGASESQPARKPQTDHSANPVYQEGLALVAKHKCMQCHAVTRTLTGPSYQDVAKKYRNAPDTMVAHLGRKVITGGKGVWGDISMIPHPTIPASEAEAMVRYILLLAD